MQNISPDNFFDWLKDEKYKQNPFISLLQKFDCEKSLRILYEAVQPVIHKRHLNISDSELQEFLLLIGIFIRRHPLVSDMGSESDPLKLNLNVPATESDFQEDILSILKKKFDIILYKNEESYFHWIINLYVGRTHYQVNHPASALQLLDNISRLIEKLNPNCMFHSVRIKIWQKI